MSCKEPWELDESDVEAARKEREAFWAKLEAQNPTLQRKTREDFESDAAWERFKKKKDRDNRYERRAVRKRRIWLINQLGGPHCAICGYREKIEDLASGFRTERSKLHIDHVDGERLDIPGNHPHFRNQYERINMYIREYRAGIKLRVLCDQCNGRDGAKRQAQRTRPLPKIGW